VTYRYGDLLADLRTAYDRGADRRDKLVKDQWRLDERTAFLDRLRAEGAERLLEIGAGTGQDSAFFAANGLAVTAVDLSPGMVEKCREKGVDARVLDFSGLADAFPAASFDAVWSMNCLLHVPHADLPPIIAQLHTVLRPGGLFFFGTWGGDGTEEVDANDSHDPPRFFAWRTMAQLENAVAGGFDVLDARTLVIGESKYPFHALTLRAVG
jgi:SAM-dependent methyltransferase